MTSVGSAIDFVYLLHDTLIMTRLGGSGDFLKNFPKRSSEVRELATRECDE